MKSPVRIVVVDDDEVMRMAITQMLQSVNCDVTAYSSPKDVEFQEVAGADCLVLDVRLPFESGLFFQQRINESGIEIPIIFITGYADVPMAVQAMKEGAVEFLQKPFREMDLLEAVNKSVRQRSGQRELRDRIQIVRSDYMTLTNAERTVMELVCEGLRSKQIAYRLSRSQNTIKIHRARVMQKMKCSSPLQLMEARRLLLSEDIAEKAMASPDTKGQHPAFAMA